MPYSLTYSLGTIFVVESTLNQQTSLGLPGLNWPAYGNTVDQNQLSLLENFATSNPAQLSRAIPGQIWYDKANGIAKLNVSNTTVPVWSNLIVGGGNAGFNNITVANITATGTITGNLTGNVTGNLTGTSITTGSNVTPGTVTGAWTLTTGSTFQATYA